MVQTDVNPPLIREKEKRKAHDLPEPDTPMITITDPGFLQ